uniref:cytochrome c oxidase subunit III n=1 Tax=Erianthus versicolor TaxID=470935 RepID=UPI0024112E5D|nr:cytochrome c oxidase subunit III [Erianthus versicolor]WEL32784.1 cytochrome c oxidase subunit III [Erianthus versicolor]
MLTLNSNQPFHLVDFSPWPLTSALGTMIMAAGLTKWFNMYEMDLIILGLTINLMTMFQWWRDVTRESTFQGLHTNNVVKGMKMGMILFITSEVLFFMSFFWAYFNSSLAPNVEIGMMWPPEGIKSFNPMNIPLLNTVVLLTSGISVTWAHHSMMESNYSQGNMSLIMTIMLGIYFTILQAYEYWESQFTLADSIYGSTFFMATGFHGIHVIIGTSFLLICMIRHLINHFSSKHHMGFEAAAWYWHFVDVVWLFLYISIYWWGS